MNKFTKTIIGLSILTVTILAVIVGISLANSPDKEKKLEKVRVQAGWLLNGEFANVCSAITNGYYTEEGLEVELIPGGPSGSNFIVATNALAQDSSIDIAIDGDIIPLIRGVAVKDVNKRMNLKAFATFWSDNPYGFFVRKDSGIRSVADFIRPKSDGSVPKLGLTSDAVIQYAIAQHLETDVTDLNIVTVGFDATPFITKQVDIIGGYWTTQAYELEEAGIEYEFIAASTIPGFTQPSMIAIASDKTLKERPDMLKKWLNATAKGARIAKDKPVSAAKDILDKRCGGPAFDQQQEEWMIRKSIPLFTTPHGAMDIKKIKDFTDTYHGIEQIPRVPEVQEYTDTTILESQKNTPEQ